MRATYGLNLQRQLQAVDSMLATGDVKQAELMCRKLLFAFPGHPAPLQQMAMIALRANKVLVAVECLRRASRSPDATASIFANLCDLERRIGRHTEAVVAGREAVSMAPGHTHGLNNLAIALQETGQLEEAIGILDKVVKLEPRNAAAHSNRGNTLRLLGRVKEAEMAFRRALRHEPGMVSAHNNLASLYILKNEWVKARAAAKKAVAISPGYVHAYVNIAESYLGEGRSAEALEEIKKALTNTPDYAPAHALAARIYKDLGHFTAALQAADKAVALQRAPQHLVVLAETLHGAGRLQEAEKVVREALARDPSSTAGQNWLAYILLDRGQAEEAAVMFEKLLSAQPERVGYFYNIAITKKYQANDPIIDRIEEALSRHNERDPGNVENSMRLYFALGKVLIDCGDNDRAFEALHKANRLKRSLVEHSNEAVQQTTSAIIAAFSEPRPTAPGQVNATRKPIFIVGMPRSGTSLIEQILASHPDVYGAGELNDFNLAVNALRGHNGGNVLFPTQMNRLSKEQSSFIADYYLHMVNARIPESRFFTDKMPSNFFYTGLISSVFPNAKIIHANRSAMDTCASCYMNLFEGAQNFSYDQSELGKYYIEYQRLMHHWKTVVPHGQMLDLCYEKLVNEQEYETRRLLEFCELHWDDRCLAFYKTERAVRTASLTQVRQPIYRSSMGRGERYRPWLGELATVLER